jgi:hypothetical protein
MLLVLNYNRLAHEEGFALLTAVQSAPGRLVLLLVLVLLEVVQEVSKRNEWTHLPLLLACLPVMAPIIEHVCHLNGIAFLLCYGVGAPSIYIMPHHRLLRMMSVLQSVACTSY